MSKDKEYLDVVASQGSDKDWKVSWSDSVKKKVDEDPKLAEYLREFGAVVRQAMAGVDSGQYKSFDEAMEKITGHKPERIEDDSELPPEVMAEFELVREEKLREFLKERDEVLRSLDVDRMIAFGKKYNPQADDEFDWEDRQLAEIGIHTARTMTTSLTKEEREFSKRWLEEHGMDSKDDGDLD